MGKLVDGRGNIITSIEKLKKMGAKAKKSLPENILSRALQQEEDSAEEENIDGDTLLNP
jgi:DNA recombination protein RmuC